MCVCVSGRVTINPSGEETVGIYLKSLYFISFTFIRSSKICIRYWTRDRCEQGCASRSSFVFCLLFQVRIFIFILFSIFWKMRFLSPFCLRFHFIYSSFLSSNEQFRHNELRNYGVTKDFMGLYSSERTSFSCNGKERKTGIIVLFSRLLFFRFLF